MRRNSVMLYVMVAALLFAFACFSAPKQASLDVSCDEFQKQSVISRESEVAIDGSLIVTLCSNPTTGFQWSESATISDEAILQQVDHKFVPPEAKGSEPLAPGTAGTEVWTFKALKQGTSTISVDYSRPWESGEKASWEFVLTVIVK